MLIFPLADFILNTFSLDPYLQSLVNWDLRKHGLILLNSVLVHCFQPVSRQISGACGNSTDTHRAFAGDVKSLLDVAVEDKLVSNNITDSSFSNINAGSSLFVTLALRNMQVLFEHHVSLNL